MFSALTTLTNAHPVLSILLNAINSSVPLISTVVNPFSSVAILSKKEVNSGLASLVRFVANSPSPDDLPMRSLYPSSGRTIE